MKKRFELLAPAGEMESAYAAFHYGADAIYLGLPRFSARAEAVNFTLDQLGEVVAYAHSLEPRRKVFVTVNTLIAQRELGEVAGTLQGLADRQVDAVIVQDLGVARIVRRHFPQLEMHASTQLAIHNIEGAMMAKELGFSRVTLARELTLDEVREITAHAGIETETFIHGALCYSYSGLCLFSSLLRGRSGNRGRCNYPCRDVCRVPKPLRDGLPFSMKDLALNEYATQMRDAGVACFKIEGRKKSPLYVATVVDYYRKLLDNELTPPQARELEARMKTVFSRPWTRFFVRSAKDQDVVDRDTVGHRGMPAGKVEAVTKGAGGLDAVRFITSRPVERHDGLQIDLPRAERPFGFPVDSLRVLDEEGGRSKQAFESQAGQTIEVSLPEQHPLIPAGAAIYVSSSQAVKRSYEYSKPKPGEFSVRSVMDVELIIQPEKVVALARVRDAGVEASASVAGRFDPAKDPARTESAGRDAFSKLGDTRLRLGTFKCANRDGLFVPVSKMNELRRTLSAEIEAMLKAGSESRIRELSTLISTADGERTPAMAPVSAPELAWSIKVDRVECLSHFEAADWNGVGEIIVDVSRSGSGELREGLAKLGGSVEREKLRLAMPMVARGWETGELRKRVGEFIGMGWARWQISNVSGWQVLRQAMAGAAMELDVTTDWPVYALNRQAVFGLAELGVRGFTCSPEDGRENIALLAKEFGAAATVVVYQDTPLFISASCAYANLAGGCAGKACNWTSLDLKLAGGENVVAINDHCLTIVVNKQPYSLCGKLEELKAMGVRSVRIDFVWKPYKPAEAVSLWRRARDGRLGNIGYIGNFDRGLM
ncbi:MAG: hypothetical protein C0404_03510 [Verrucomicrobia bacterium]|nr:hypothetical protein [Verrucomicrobiota bacterium]